MDFLSHSERVYSFEKNIVVDCLRLRNSIFEMGEKSNKRQSLQFGWQCWKWVFE